MNAHSKIAEAIDRSPLNRGLCGVDWIANPKNVFVMFNNGDIALFEHEGDNDYQGHTLFLSTGKLALDHGKTALRMMFAQKGAKLIFGLTPDHLRHVKLFNRLLGFKSAGIRPTPEGACELFVLSRDMWKVK